MTRVGSIPTAANFLHFFLLFSTKEILGGSNHRSIRFVVGVTRGLVGRGAGYVLRTGRVRLPPGLTFFCFFLKVFWRVVLKFSGLSEVTSSYKMVLYKQGKMPEEQEKVECDRRVFTLPQRYKRRGQGKTAKQKIISVPIWKQILSKNKN